MTKRKSFIIHIDSLEILDDLTNEQAGLLFKAIKSHHLNSEIDLDPLTRIAFSPFKNQFIRDDEKYILTCERRADAGSRGGKAKASNSSKSKQSVANATNCKQDLANVADSVSKSVNDNKSVSKNEKEKSQNKFSDEDLKLSLDIYSLLLKVNAKHKEPNYKTWASDIRLMRERDNHTHAEIMSLFGWANNHQFWKGNILSPSKLRQQWDKLTIQRGSTKENKHGNFEERDYKEGLEEFGGADWANS